VFHPQGLQEVHKERMDKFSISDTLAEIIFPDNVVRRVVKEVDDPTTMSKLPDMYKNGKNMYRVRDASGACIFERVERVCFAPLLTWLNGQSYGVDGDPRRAETLEYTLPVHNLTNSEVLRWFQAAKAAGGLSSKIEDVNDLQALVKRGVCRIPLVNTDITVAELYITLCVLRWIREGGSLIRDTLRLVDEAGREFWSALAFCHFRVRGHSSGQGLYPYTGAYVAGGMHESSYTDLAMVRRIRRIANSSTPIDNDLLFTTARAGDGISWNWFRHLRTTNNIIFADRAMLLTDAALPAIWATDDDRAAALIQHACDQDKLVVVP